jgi:hypothetical protein
VGLGVCAGVWAGTATEGGGLGLGGGPRLGGLAGGVAAAGGGTAGTDARGGGEEGNAAVCGEDKDNALTHAHACHDATVCVRMGNKMGFKCGWFRRSYVIDKIEFTAALGTNSNTLGDKSNKQHHHIKKKNSNNNTAYLNVSYHFIVPPLPPQSCTLRCIRGMRKSARQLATPMWPRTTDTRTRLFRRPC